MPAPALEQPLWELRFLLPLDMLLLFVLGPPLGHGCPGSHGQSGARVPASRCVRTPGSSPFPVRVRLGSAEAERAVTCLSRNL